jgi:hypothetical protein
MSGKSSTGCLGCVGTLFVLCIFGSIFFGGGVLMKVGPFGFSSGKDPINRQQIIADYVAELADSKKLAEDSVQKFRSQIERNQCKDVYDRSSVILKKHVSQLQMISLCKDFKKMGPVKSSQLSDWWGQPTDKDTEKYILLRYTTTFSKFSTLETFIWIVKGSKPELVEYLVFPQPISNNNIPKRPIPSDKSSI